MYWRSNEESVQGERLKGYARSRELTEGASRADRVQAAGKSPAPPVSLTAAGVPLVLCLLLTYTHMRLPI